MMERKRKSVLVHMQNRITQVMQVHIIGEPDIAGYVK